MEPQPFDARMLALISWFETAKLPQEPFYLGPGVYVVQPAGFYRILCEEIEAGPTTPRARTRALQGDLALLKAYVDRSTQSVPPVA